jgi:hypothetical protein
LEEERYLSSEHVVGFSMKKAKLTGFEGKKKASPFNTGNLPYHTESRSILGKPHR